MKNWVTSTLPVDSKFKRQKLDCPTVSAGSKEHEECQSTAFNSVWKWIDKKLCKPGPVNKQGEVGIHKIHTSDTRTKVDPD